MQPDVHKGLYINDIITLGGRGGYTKRWHFDDRWQLIVGGEKFHTLCCFVSSTISFLCDIGEQSISKTKWGIRFRKYNILYYCNDQSYNLHSYWWRSNMKIKKFIGHIIIAFTIILWRLTVLLKIVLKLSYNKKFCTVQNFICK